ncbi:DUF2975 domain-containing protein [Bifidobacterium scaligerum]|uniref:DUF2975 domain-containing protein n=1 Tax=Bifidobacterium scaligerum TaxID=2052656 RepID=A0A2M9HSS5_9BIFI|nr:DUF2975 domain-containing protein [Bifidobacterium scaligerum]PJM79857.1 DUF2975 domain-containing protein [Bifidobacterium scaligerum]
MKQYMNRWVLLGLKIIVVTIWLGCIWGQIIAAPVFSEAIASLYSSQPPLRWLYLILGELFLVCVEIAFIGVWRLFSLSGSGTVFTAKALPCVNLIIGCASAGTVFTATVLGLFAFSSWNDATMRAMDYFGILAALGATFVAEIGFILLMIVMKGLLRAATDQSSELEQVI